MRHVLTSAAAWAAAALASVVVGPPASAVGPAAPETDCEGVTVVVDYGDLDRALHVDCAAPGTAAEVFDDAGIALEYLPQQPGFVCRVGGAPKAGPCFDGDAYWSLWSSDEGEWAYATLGVSQLEVPAGGSVGFAWHRGEGDAVPPDFPLADGASTTPTDESTDDTADDAEDGGIPLWAVGGVAVLVLGAAAVPVIRRRGAVS